MDSSVKTYLSKIGRRGGMISRRKLDPDDARAMVRVREARRAFKQYYVSCFWSYAPDLHIGKDDLTWVAEQLKKHGGRAAWEAGAKLCR